MLGVGDREQADGTIAVLSRSAGDQGSSPVGDFIARAADEVRRKVS